MRRAKVEERPAIIKRPLKLSRSRVLGLVAESWFSKDDSLLNHFSSIIFSFPSSLSLAISLDISGTNGEPFLKAYKSTYMYIYSYVMKKIMRTH